MIIPIEEFVETHKRLSERAFLSRFDHPFLLLVIDAMDEDTGVFTTLQIEGLQSDDVATDSGCYVAGITKREGKAEASTRVTLGRTKNNDIPIHHPALSKLHCFFKEGEEGAMTVVDIKSTNGTKLNTKDLEKNTPYTIKEGDKIIFAEKVEGTYLTPVGLHSQLGFGL